MNLCLHVSADLGWREQKMDPCPGKSKVNLTSLSTGVIALADRCGIWIFPSFINCRHSHHQIYQAAMVNIVCNSDPASSGSGGDPIFSALARLLLCATPSPSSDDAGGQRPHGRRLRRGLVPAARLSHPGYAEVVRDRGHGCNQSDQHGDLMAA